MIGKAVLEIKYCVTLGYFWQAAAAAAEICDGRVRETDIILTPVGDRRFEIYLNDEKVYDRKASPETHFSIGHEAIGKVKERLADAIASGEL